MNWLVENTDGRVRLGRILSRIGWFWALLFAVANFAPSTGTPFDEILSFFGATLWLPFMLVFAGRALARGATGGESETSEEKKSEASSTPPIFPFPGEGPPPRPQPRVQTKPQPKPQPEPQPKPRREPAPRFESESRAETTSEPEPSFDPAVPDMPTTPTYKVKTSAEMIEEAKKRLSDR